MNIGASSSSFANVNFRAAQPALPIKRTQDELSLADSLPLADASGYDSRPLADASGFDSRPLADASGFDSGPLADASGFDSQSDGIPIDQVTSPEDEAAELKDKFQDFVGQTFFSELIKSLRTAQQGASYFNGGRAEQVFQGQFDQMMSEHLSEASAQSISDPMFELFQLGRMSG